MLTVDPTITVTNSDSRIYCELLR